MTPQPTTAPPAAMSHVANRCFHRAHEGTGLSRQNTTKTSIAEIKPASDRMMRVIASGVPKMSAAPSAITAAGTSALLIGVLIAGRGLLRPNYLIIEGMVS